MPSLQVQDLVVNSRARCLAKPSVKTSLITLDVINVVRYVGAVIKGFRDPDAERLFTRQPVRKLGANVQRAALRKLRLLDAAVSLEDLRVPPGNRLEKLKGDRAGRYSIRINEQWRICFAWAAGDAHEVEIVDYH
jgi:proteic killer suppression protein